jgi:hypothetical protein
LNNGVTGIINSWKVTAMRANRFCSLVLLFGCTLLALAACGRQSDSDEEREVAVAVALTQTAAAQVEATPTSTVAATPTPAPTATPPPSPTPTALPLTAEETIAAAAAELETFAALNLGLEPGTTGNGIAGVRAFKVENAPAGENLWLVYTYGLRDGEQDQNHLLVFYSQHERGWREVASVELATISPAEPGPDSIADGAVQQVEVEPTNVWVQVEGGIGAHSGVYALYRFDGRALRREVFGANTHPQIGQLDDLNGDGVPEVVLDISDYAVLCEECGVRYAQYNLFHWDGTRMAPVSLTPLAESAPAALREANGVAVTLAAAGLWQEATDAIEKGSTLNLEDPIFEWNAVYIQYNAQAKQPEIDSTELPSYPLLAHLFYGDYAAALDVMRRYVPADIFSLRTPLVVGTPAEGVAQQLANRILSSVEPVLRVRPNLAAAHYLRGWATYLRNGFADEAVLADLERAAQLDGDDPLFVDTLVFFGGDPSTLSLAAPRAATVQPTATLTATSPVTVTAGAESTLSPAGASSRGLIYYSAPDEEGRSAIFGVAATPGAQPTGIVSDAIQPALQPGGERLAFHSTRDDMLGLGGFDLATGERVRFAFNVEDSLPTWNPAGNQLYFASTRYGDGRWRLYQLWADGNGEATDMRYGQDPSWHPSEDLIVYKGCDDAGGHCGLWLMRSDGADRRLLTDNAGDARPRWVPGGATVVFMSDQRDGNWEVYLVTVATGAVTRLTNHPADDGLPVVSPDGTTVAFLSNRGDGWAIWTAPVNGGVAEQLVMIGDVANWLEQGLDWVE